MEGKKLDRIWLKIITTVLFLFVILNHGGLFNLEIAADFNHRSTRSSDELIWIQTTQMDFMNGTSTNITVTPTGEVKLELVTKFVEDNFLDESKIGYKNNVFIYSIAGEVRLLTNDDVTINKTFGGTLHDSAKSVQETSDRGYIVAGSTASYGGGGDVWLIKTDSSGNEQWNKTFNRNIYDGGNSLQQTSDGGYIIAGHTGTYSGGTQDVWLIKTDSSGNEQWNKTYDKVGKGDESYSIQQTSDGGYIIVGRTAITTSDSDIWLLKTDSSGVEQWNKTFGGSNDDEGDSVRQTSDGGYIIAGWTDSYGSGSIDAWLIKTDSLGNEQWNKTFGGSEYEHGQSVQQTSDGCYIIAGVTMSYGSGGEDLWLIKTDSLGSELWNKTFGGSSDEIGKSVQITSDGGYILGGWTQSYGAGSYDAWLIKTDSSGKEEWNKTCGGSEPDDFNCVQQSSSNDYICVGSTMSYDVGDWDAWLIKIYAPENIPNSSGEFASINLLSGHDVYLINSFSSFVNIPSEAGLKVQFSQDNTSWYDSSGNLNNWETLSDGNNHIDLSPLSWSGPNFFYKMNFTSNTTDSPIVYNITLSYSACLPSGNLKSQSFDSNTYPAWKYLNWSAQIPSGTELKFQLRTAGTNDDLMNKTFIGPDGSSDTFYTSPGKTIYMGHERDRWLQYKAHFSTTNLSLTPVLEEVTITYEPIDTDNDGTEDFNDLDDDNDNIPDTWESEYDLNPLNHSDANLDPDLDGLTNLQEFLNYSKPYMNDTDGDNLGDGFEVIFSKTNASLWDTNGNGVGDGLEFIQSKGYLGWIESLPDDWIGMIISWENYTIFVKTNSSVLEGEFDKEEQKLKIKVSGPNGTLGVTEIDVPKSLCEPEDIEIKLDGGLINYTLTEDDTYYYIHIEYNHSTHELTAKFAHFDEGPTGSDDEEGLPAQYLIAVISIVILIIIMLLGVTRIRNGFQNNEIPELPPEELSKMLEERYADGEMTDETYNDIKSLLENYGNSEEKH